MAGTVGRFEAAFGAERDGTQGSDEWTWTDLSARTQDNEAVITRGRMANQQQVQPATLGMPLDNGDGALTPRHPGSTFFPHVVKGLPVRHSVATGNPFLRTTGASGSVGASTPDHADLDITTDLALAVELVAPARYRLAVPAFATDATGGTLIGKWTPTSDQRSYRLAISALSGNLALVWSTAGTLATVVSQTADLPKPANGPHSVAATLDVNNGLGGYTVRFYSWPGTIAELIANLTLALFKEVVTTAGTTSIFSSSAVAYIGGNLATNVGTYAGDVTAAKVFAGDLTGALRANPDFGAQAVGAGSFTDSTGKLWTVGSAGAITNYRRRFYGELAASAPTWPGASVPNTAQVAWQAAGVLRRMRQHGEPLDSAMRRTVGSPANRGFVHAYWPLDDGSQATSCESPTPGVGPLAVSGVQFGADSTCPGSDPVLNIAQNQGYGWSGVVPDPGGSPTFWRWEWFHKFTTPATSPAQTIFGVVDLAGSIGAMYVGLNTTTQFIIALTNQGAFHDQTVASAPEANHLGVWMYYSLKLQQNGGNVDVNLDYIALEGPLQGIPFGFSDSYAGTYGRMRGIRHLAAAPSGGISYGNFMVSTDRAFGWLANADTGWRGEAATHRVRRLCQEQGVPIYVDGPYDATSTGGVTQGVAAMGEQRSLPLLTLLEECAKADFGYLSEAHATEGLAYRTGATLVNQTPRITVNNEVTRDLAPADDDQGFINDLTVEQTEGSRRRATDQDSVDSQGRYEGTETVNVNTADQLANQAGLRLAIATWPEMRYPGIPMELSKDAALWPGWVAAKPGDLILANGLPSTHPTPTLRQLLDGYTETISPHRWYVLANTTPEGPWLASVIDTDGTPNTALGALDTDGSELSAGVTSVATSLSVAITAGPLWTTVAANYPLDIDVGYSGPVRGERMTVTAVSGGASPQTFTVTRGVDGLAKAHSSGAKVRLWLPLRLTV